MQDHEKSNSSIDRINWQFDCLEEVIFLCIVIFVAENITKIVT